MSIEQTMRMASGYLELGMADEALFELERLPWRSKSKLDVMELKLAAQMKIGHWNLASDTARMLCLKAGHEPRFFLDAASCLHETGDTAAACHWLMRGPKALYGMAIFHYNIACYFWTLGQEKRAKVHLFRALEMDEELIHVARNDSDLMGMEPVL